MMVLQRSKRELRCSAPTQLRRRCPSTSPGAQRASPGIRLDTKDASGATIRPGCCSMMCRPNLPDENRREQGKDECLNERDQDLEEHDEQRHRQWGDRDLEAEHED